MWRFNNFEGALERVKFNQSFPSVPNFPPKEEAHLATPLISHKSVEGKSYI
jgi:hypothetical protein